MAVSIKHMKILTGRPVNGIVPTWSDVFFWNTGDAMSVDPKVLEELERSRKKGIDFDYLVKQYKEICSLQGIKLDSNYLGHLMQLRVYKYLDLLGSVDVANGVMQRLDLPSKDGLALFVNPQGKRFDDRAFRVSKVVGNDVFNGPAVYPEQITAIRSVLDSKYYSRLVSLGISEGDARKYIANVSHVNLLIQSNDDKLLLGLRSENVALYPNHWHLIGGKVDYVEHFFGVLPNIASTNYKEHVTRLIKREFMEEILGKKYGVTSMTEPEYLGIVDGLTSPDISFKTKVNLTGEQMENMVKNAPDRYEHKVVQAVSLVDNLLNFLTVNRDNVTPFVYGALILNLERQAIELQDASLLEIRDRVLELAPEEFAVPM